MPRRVLIVLSPIIDESAERFLRGIALAQKEAGETWSTHWDDEDLTGADPEAVLSSSWDGVISRHSTAKLAAACERIGIPLIDLNDGPHLPGTHQIVPDNAAIGRAAAKHFIERGLRCCAYSGQDGESWSEERRQGFFSALEAEAFLRPYLLTTPLAAQRTAAGVREETHVLSLELLTFPKPFGVFCCHDMRAAQVAEAARLARLRVPEDIHILGANDDLARCLFRSPTLSSIPTAQVTRGYLGARRLLDLWSATAAGRRPPASLAPASIRIQPEEAIVRESTDAWAVPDNLVRIALGTLKTRFNESRAILQAARSVGLSRVQLERRFQESLKRSPGSELQRLRLAKAKALLADPALPIKAIATAVGFKHTPTFSAFFRRESGMSPGRYRAKLR
jgi:LacI family transcriptional regulator